jgi:two-component system, NtrC family, sensor kinase
MGQADLYLKTTTFKTITQMKKSWRHWLLLPGMFLSILFVSAQYTQLDSLKQQLQKTFSLKDRFGILHQIAINYKNRDKLDSMLDVCSEQLGIAHELKNDSFLVITYNNIGNALEVKGDYTLALEFYLKGLHLAETNGSLGLIHPFYNNIALIYLDLGNFDLALDWLLKARKQVPILGPRYANYYSLIDMNISETYMGLKRYDSALAFVKSSFATLLPSDYGFMYSNLMYDFGQVYEFQNKPELASEYYNKSILFADSVQDLFHLADASKFYGRFLLKQKDFSNTRKYAVISLRAAQDASYKAGIVDAAEVLSEMYTQTHHLDSAYFYGNMKNLYRDSLFNEKNVNQLKDMTLKEHIRESELEQAEEQYQTRIKIYLLAGGVAIFLLLAVILLRNNRQKQKAYTLLSYQKKEIDLQKTNLEKAIAELKSAQAQLIHAEKMASLGDLTAGIAHEIQNPLNFVNNFSEVSIELLKEYRDVVLNDMTGREKEETSGLVTNLTQNLEKIEFHGKRAEVIVKGMLEHSKGYTGQKKLTSLAKLAEDFVRLAKSNQLTKDKAFNTQVETILDQDLPPVEIVPEDIGRVLVNLLGNAFYSVKEKKKLKGDNFTPVVTVSVSKTSNAEPHTAGLELKVRDNGMGISGKMLDKIFQPFFTTKPAGTGTGLGLSISYDIITNEHGGFLKVKSVEGEYTEFIVYLPIGI